MYASDIKTVESFNTLIGINNTRIECYSYVLNNGSSAVFNALLSGLVDTSLFCNRELTQQVYKYGGTPFVGTLSTPAFLAAWTGISEAVVDADNCRLALALATAECLAASSYSRVLLDNMSHYNTQQSEIVRSHVAMLHEEFIKVKNVSELFVSEKRQRTVTRETLYRDVEATISLIEPLKTAGRRILASIAAMGSNFGPSIR